MGSTMGNGDKTGWKKAAAFLAGLSLYQMPHAVISAGNFTVGRFQIPQKYVGLYINKMIISYRIFSLIGITLTTIYEQFGGSNIPKLNIGLFVLVALSHLMLLFTYCSGGDQGHITLYYWIVVLVALIIGMCFVFSVLLARKEIAYLLAALPISGILASSYHVSFIVLSRYIHTSKTYYLLVFWQIVWAILLITVTTGVWAYAYHEDTGNGNGNSSCSTGETTTNNNCSLTWSALKKSLSPLLLVSLGYSLQNMFYPSVAPYKIIGMDKGYKIDVAVLLTSAIPPLLILDLNSKSKGPNTNWNEKAKGWHATWIFFIIEVICGALFLSAMHYPSKRLPKMIKSDVWVLGFLTVLYDFSAQFTRAVGTNGVDMQDTKAASKMNTLNSFLHSFTQVIFAFIGDGYIRAYRRAEESSGLWPTKHYTRLRSFWFWIWSATKVSFTSLKSVFSTDVRAEILGKKEYLFIVHEDVEDNKYIFEIPKPRKKEYLFTI